MRNWWLKTSCFLTGWNINILDSCTEVSRKQLKKYASAILILVIIWALTGYLFSQRYIGTPWWGSLIAALFFSIIIIQIERVVILTVGKNKFSTIFRIFLALIMAILGSTILDQIIFKKDIEKKMIEIVDRQVEEQLPKRLIIINSKLAELQHEIDSLDKRTLDLYNDISSRPTIKTISSSTVFLKIQQPDGSIKTVPQHTTSTNPIENPKNKEVTNNILHLEQLRKQKEEYTNKKLASEKLLRSELKSTQGFLEELSAIKEILSEKPIALIFYLILFSFLVCLELLVLSSKIGDTKSDYDLVVEHQLDRKIKMLSELKK
ncbi:MAG: DUF4407 domain-containing protein [Pedobacter sp.]|nr:MAG: DUF4407 domain-containing protein [Pedobacter sp.]